MRASARIPWTCSAVASLACSADPNAGALTSSGGIGGSGIEVSDARAGGESGFEKCAGTISIATTNPLDLFVMLDQSGSMLFHTNQSSNLSKWEAVTQAISSFVGQPNLANVSIGLQYFGQWLGTGSCATAVCTIDGDCGPGCGPCTIDNGASHGLCAAFDDKTSCNPDDYARAAVPIAPLPGNAQAMIDSMTAHWPFSSTPTVPALGGALTFAASWAIDHPGHVVATILATDGLPAGCGPDDDIQRVADVARRGYAATPSIPTYAIGIGSGEDDLGAPDAGYWKDNLNLIAAAGGTTNAFIVRGNVVGLFIDALNRIRGTALGCAYLLPDAMGKELDVHLVNILYTKGGAASAAYIPKVASSSDCATADGWYYDDEQRPTRILTCPSTCNKLSGDFSGKVEIQVGCAAVPR